MSRFFVDGSSDDPTDCRIPGDPLRYAPLGDPAADAMRRWGLFARALLGKAAMDLLRQHDLVVIPGPTWRRALAAAQAGRDSQSDGLSDTSCVSGRESQT